MLNIVFCDRHFVRKGEHKVMSRGSCVFPQICLSKNILFTRPAEIHPSLCKLCCPSVSFKVLAKVNMSADTKMP